jgi:hypothetical protein
MKKFLRFGAVLVAFVLIGCSMRYDVTLRRGSVITSKGKPKLDARGFYTFMDVEGHTNRIHQDAIKQIAPTSDRGSKESFFNPK